MKNFFAFLVICLWILGGVGGVGYCIYIKAWIIAIGVLANALLAFPKVKEAYEALTM